VQAQSGSVVEKINEPGQYSVPGIVSIAASHNLRLIWFECDRAFDQAEQSAGTYIGDLPAVHSGWPLYLDETLAGTT
jgi:hypothetical protein